MENRPFKLYLGSVPGNLSSGKLADALKSQLVSFVKVETNMGKTRDKEVKNKGYAFLTISDPAEYEELLHKLKGLTIGNRKLKVSEYKAGPVAKSEKLLAASKKICIKGLPEWVTDDDLKRAFHHAGLSPETVFRAQRQTNHENFSFGFAEFREPFMAQMALNRAKLPLLPSKEVYILLEKFVDRSSKDCSAEPDQQNVIVENLATQFENDAFQQEVIVPKPNPSFGENQQTKSVVYNKNTNLQHLSNSQYPAINREFEDPELSPKYQYSAEFTESHAVLGRTSASPKKNSVFPSLERMIWPQCEGKVSENSPHSASLRTVVQHIEDRAASKDPSSDDSKRSVSRKRSNPEQPHLEELGIFHHHSSQRRMFQFNNKASPPYTEIIGRESEFVRLTQPWLDSVKTHQHQMAFWEIRNLRFNFCKN